MLLLKLYCCVCVFFLQYSEKALYNQLCFYRFIFDWDYAAVKVLQVEERSKTHTSYTLLVIALIVHRLDLFIKLHLIVFIPFLLFCYSAAVLSLELKSTY